MATTATTVHTAVSNESGTITKRKRNYPTKAQIEEIGKLVDKNKNNNNGNNNNKTPPRKRQKDSTYNPETEIQEVESSTTSSAQTSASSLHFRHESLPDNFVLPSQQKALLLHAKKQPYQLTSPYDVPTTSNPSEIIIRIHTIGLNPIDWKAPDFGFGIPAYPYLAGREFVGQIVSTPDHDQNTAVSNMTSAKTCRVLCKGDFVLVPSTDYRDPRKAAFQEYAVAASFSVCRIPARVQDNSSLSGLGVAFVAAAISLGVCFGADFSSSIDGDIPPGPHLRTLLQALPERSIPNDVQSEALGLLSDNEKPQPGEWLAIWGGSSATANIAAQLARYLKLRVLLVVDTAKHGATLSQGAADLIVDSHDTDRAIAIIKQVTQGNLRLGIDTVGKETATLLRETLRADDGNRPSHLVGLTGLPKETVKGIVQHTMPIKLFHEVPVVGEALMAWLEKLLVAGVIVPPPVEIEPGIGLENVNTGLNRMRKGEIAGKRLAVRVA